ncbi:MAG: hypothetical protein AB8G11_05380 [Saprospiraceae bacterium]
MDWINDLSTQLKQSFVFSNGGFEPIVIKNPTVQFRWRTIFITGEITFSTFESIVDDEVFNFDIDFVRPMQDGSMMLIGKPVQIKIALEHSVVYQNFDIKMRQADFEETLHRLLSDSESPFLSQYHWMVLSMYQNQNSKQVGHETIWNLINYDDSHLMENWDDLVGEASLHFVSQQGLIDDFVKDVEENDFSTDELSQIFDQAKDQLMDKDNPMGNILSKMFGNEADFQDAISESMNQMMGMFGGVEEEEADDFDDAELVVEEVITDHLEMLEIAYEKEEDSIFTLTHESDLTGKSYECSIVVGEDYLHTVTTYDKAISKEKYGEIYRLFNGLNIHLNYGKLLLVESIGIVALRTELPAPVTQIPDETITDMIDENWVCANESFNILDYFLEGKLTYEQAIEEAEDSFL